MLSFPHLVIIFIVALLVFGPEKLPEIARQIGKVMGDFRKASTDFRRVIEQEFAEMERQTREKEEAARRKALEAATPANAPAGSISSGAASSAATGAEQGTPAIEDPALRRQGAGEPAIAPANTVANTAAKDSGYNAWGAPPNSGKEGAASSAATSSENPASPADVHPA